MVRSDQNPRRHPAGGVPLRCDVYLAALAAFSVLYGAVLHVADRPTLQTPDSVLIRQPHGLRPPASRRWAKSALPARRCQMFTHGTITALLFVMVGLISTAPTRARSRTSAALAHVMPFAAMFFVIAGLASLGLPTMSGFVAELLVFLGSFDDFTIPTILAVFGILLSAGYITWTVQRVFYGPKNERWATLTDTTEWWEMVCMAGLAAIIDRRRRLPGDDRRSARKRRHPHAGGGLTDARRPELESVPSSSWRLSPS